MTNELVLRAASGAVAVPAIIEQAGGNARVAYGEFFRATIVDERLIASSPGAKNAATY